MWKGSWNADKTVFTGEYAHADGSKFVGQVFYTDKHVITHSWPNMGEKRVEMPVEPHFEFTGSLTPPGAPLPPHPEW